MVILAIASSGITRIHLANLTRYSLNILLSLVMVCESAGATLTSTPLQIAQQSGTTPQDATQAVAEQVYQQGLELFQQGTAESLRQAINKFEQAIALWRKLNNKSKQALALLGIGRIYSGFGEKQKALTYYNESLRLYQQVRDKSSEANTINNIGGVYLDLSERQKALAYYNQALLLWREVGNKRGEAFTLNSLGGIYLELNEKQKALAYYNQALPLRREVGDKKGEATTLNALGLVYSELGEKQKALAYYNQALPLRREMEDKVGEATTLNNLAVLYSQLGEKQKALAYHNQALPLRREVGDKMGEATTLNNLAVLYSELGEKQKALSYYNQALPLRREVGDKRGEAITLFNIAYVQRNQGNLQAALSQIEASIKIIENLRIKIDSQELRASYFASVHNYYQFYIDLLMQLHKQNSSQAYDALALHISERYRARGLLELLTEAHADIRNGVDPGLLATEEQLQQQINDKTKLLQQTSTKPNTQAIIAKLQQEIADLLNQQQDLITKIRTTSPKYAALKYPQPLKLPQIQQQLDPDTLLLEYSLGQERSYVWAVTPNSVDSYELPARKQIEEAVHDFRQRLVDPTATLLTNQLSQIILAPVAAKLGQKRLVIVADGALQQIPFAALIDPISDSSGVEGQRKYQPLIVNHEIVNLPSITTIATQRQNFKGRKNAPKTLAILANPVFEANDPRVTGKSTTNVNSLDLRRETQLAQLKQAARNLNRYGWEAIPGTAKEAQAILKLVPSSDSLQAFDFDANYNWATSTQLSQYRFLHFATHGFADPNNPELSGIILSLVDKAGKSILGYLQLGDIFNLNFPADLVVLSACETGLGKDISGEGLVGLTRGLMYAGAERVAVSLWRVDDDATAQLMQEFYKQMLQQGKLPTAALREAQLKLWKNPNLNRPLFWAAFILQGEWR